LWGKKGKHCNPADPADAEQGSFWDHVLFDPQSKLVITVVIGRRNEETLFEAFTDFYERTDGHLPDLFTTDEYAPYTAAIVHTYGVWREELELTEAEREELGEVPEFYFPEEIAYATVHKERRQGRVVKVEPRVVLGTAEQVAEALEQGQTSATVNTSYVERYHGTQRHCNARKARKVYTFSKELAFHEAVTWLCVVWYNFCWKVRTLRQQVQEAPPRYHYRTPAMAAGLAEQPWTMEQILTYPLFPAKPPPDPPPRAESLEGG
jgi:hypothetical protein